MLQNKRGFGHFLHSQQFTAADENVEQLVPTN